MAMLAEQKSKQKWSDDPRNTKWSSDKERYGYQMLEKMGWASGKGLGKEQSGNTSHVKIKKRKENLGLGAKQSHDNDWISHQDDFNNLLSALQQHNGNAELETEEKNEKKAMLEVAKASKKRVFYKKFIRSKDTSQYSQKDMACIFGALPSQSAPATPLSQSDDENEAEDSTASCPTIPCNSSPGFVTFKSEQNIQDYFARRMRELRDGKGIERIEEGDSGDEGVHHGTREDDVGNKKGNSDNCVERNSQKLKKQKKSRIEVKDDGGDTVNDEKIVSENFKKNICGNEDESNEKVDKKKSKKSKKSKRRKIDEIDGVEILENNIECVDDEVGQELCEDDVLSVGKGENIKTKKNKKKNKLKDMSVSKTIVNETNLCDEEAVPFEKEKIHRKKCKKRKTDELEMVANGTDQIEEDIGSFVKDKVKRKKKKKR